MYCEVLKNANDDLTENMIWQRLGNHKRQICKDDSDAEFTYTNGIGKDTGNQKQVYRKSCNTTEKLQHIEKVAKQICELNGRHHESCHI